MDKQPFEVSGEPRPEVQRADSERNARPTPHQLLALGMAVAKQHAKQLPGNTQCGCLLCADYRRLAHNLTANTPHHTGSKHAQTKANKGQKRRKTKRERQDQALQRKFNRLAGPVVTKRLDDQPN